MYRLMYLIELSVISFFCLLIEKSNFKIFLKSQCPSRRCLLISYCCPSHKWSQVRGVQISQFATYADHFCNATWSWAGGERGGIPMIVLKEGEITLFLYFCRSICSTKIASNFRVFRIITSTKWMGGREWKVKRYQKS